MFGGFKASLKILGGGVGKRNKNYELAPDMNVVGAYRISRDDPYGFNTQTQGAKNGSRTLEDAIPHIRPAKSTPNLNQPRPVIPNLRNSNSTNEVSSDPRGAENDRIRNSTNIAKEQPNKKIEKQRAAEEKARQKQIAQERAKQEKLMKEQQKRDAKLAKEKAKRKSKQPAPQPGQQNAPQSAPLPKQQNAPQSAPQPRQQNAPQSAPQPRQQNALQSAPQPRQQNASQSAQQNEPQTIQAAPQRPRRAQQSRDNTNPTEQRPYSTNTLESSISRSTGPPPYAEDPDEINKDLTGNVTYRKPKPKDEGSWDMISQHRQQITRPNTSANVSKQNKQMVMDLNYNFEQRVDKENSDA